MSMITDRDKIPFAYRGKNAFKPNRSLEATIFYFLCIQEYSFTREIISKIDLHNFKVLFSRLRFTVNTLDTFHGRLKRVFFSFVLRGKCTRHF